MSMTYGVFLRTFGPCGPEPLIRPSDEFLDRLAPVLNLSRGRKVAFYLEFDYSVNPAEALADAVVPSFEAATPYSIMPSSSTSSPQSSTGPQAGTSGPSTAPSTLSATILPVHSSSTTSQGACPSASSTVTV